MNFTNVNFTALAGRASSADGGATRAGQNGGPRGATVPTLLPEAILDGKFRPPVLPYGVLGRLDGQVGIQSRGNRRQCAGTGRGEVHSKAAKGPKSGGFGA